MRVFEAEHQTSIHLPRVRALLARLALPELGLFHQLDGCQDGVVDEVALRRPERDASENLVTGVVVPTR